MNNKYFACFDFETTGLDPQKNEITQIACEIINPTRLEIIDRFSSMVGILDEKNVSQAALDVTGFTIEQLKAGPHPKAVWKEFVDFVNQYNSGNSIWTAATPVGFNISFDLGFARKYAKLYGGWDKNKNQFSMFHYTPIDVLGLAFSWFEFDKSIKNMKLTTLMEYFGVPQDKAHSATYDVAVTSEIFIRFLKLHRKLRSDHGVRFKGCMSKWKPEEL